MDFYYRPLPQNRCEIVCTRCFVTIGAASDGEEICFLEGRHQCVARSGAAPVRRPSVPPVPSPVHDRNLQPVAPRRNRVRIARNAVLLLATATLLYVFPTVVEFDAMHNWSPWIVTVLVGDLTGCACLALVFRKGTAGVVLYCLLGVIKVSMYAFHMAALAWLPWIADLIPTLIVSAFILRAPGRTARLIPIS